jgi:uncharacterized protein (DUF2141 family)
VNGVLSVQLKLEQGEFGIALIDDENENSELDRNSIKVPKEGFGFSDFYLEQLKNRVLMILRNRLNWIITTLLFV